VECRGVDFSKPLDQETIDEIQAGIDQYGLVLFRKTGMTDTQYADFAEHFGEIAIPPNPSKRFDEKRLTDPSNIHPDGKIVQKGELQWYIGIATATFHVDNSYDPRRVRYTTIKAVEVPPEGTGGATEYADSRTAYDDLDDETKAFIDDKIGVHSIFQSRVAAVPDFPTFKSMDPNDYYMAKHPLVQIHKGSLRKDLYLAGHLHHIDGMSQEEGWALIQKLLKHTTQDKYVYKNFYKDAGDVVIWDNTAVLHRAGPGTYAGKYRRDMRRATMFDNTPEEWGFNHKDDPKPNAMEVIQKRHNELMGSNEKGFDFD